MKRVSILFALQLILFCVYAGQLDNKKIKVSGNDHTDHLIVPMLDNGYLLVTRNENPCGVIRLNPLGNVAWSKVFDLPSGTQLLDAGIFDDTTIFLIYQQNANYIVLKLAANGNLQWTNEFDFSTESPYETFPAAKTTADGSLIFAPRIFGGIVGVKISAGGNVSPSFIIVPDSTDSGKDPGMDAVPTPDNGMIVIGKNDTAPVIVRLDSNGAQVWMVQYGNGYYNRPHSITNTADGNYLVAGFLADITETNWLGGWLIKLSAAGEIIWKKRYSAITDSILQTTSAGILEVMENQDGTILAAGFGFNKISEAINASVMKLDATGNVLTAYEFEQDTNAIAGRIYKTGDKAMLSTVETNLSTGFFQTMLIDPDSLSTYCKAHSFNVTVDTMPAVNNLPPNGFSRLSLTPPSHPNIVLRDSTATVVTKSLCLVSGVEQIASADIAISIMPNPAKSADLVTMRWPDELVVSHLSLYDLSGRLIKQMNVSATGTVSFSSDGLIPGFYVVEILSGGNERVGVRKLVVGE